MTDELSRSARNSRLAKAWDINALFYCRLVSEEIRRSLSGTFVSEIGYWAQIDVAIGCKRTSAGEENIDNQHRRGREQFLNT